MLLIVTFYMLLAVTHLYLKFPTSEIKKNFKANAILTGLD